MSIERELYNRFNSHKSEDQEGMNALKKMLADNNFHVSWDTSSGWEGRSFKTREEVDSFLEQLRSGQIKDFFGEPVDPEVEVEIKISELNKDTSNSYKSEEKETYYMIPQEEGNIRGALTKEEYEDRVEEFREDCIPFYASTEVGTPFNSFLIDVMPDTFEVEDIQYDEIYGEEPKTNTHIAIVPMNRLDFFWDVLEMGEILETSKEEYLEVMNSSDTLTQDQLDMFHRIYDDETEFGLFRGVAFTK